MDPEIARLLIEFTEKVGLLKKDMKTNKELERYAARVARVDQKFSALAEFISRDDPEFAKLLRRAFEMPGMSLAFRNADHQKELKRQRDDEES